jgi:asparagine synthase (glutamine-hydrolysing)
MCGICGQFNFRSGAPVEPARIATMTRAIAHRGPDDDGFFVEGALGLGFRRLSIIDLAGGHQPMSDAEERVWVVFNGEIYNFPELRAELEAHGHVFRTRSDTEVIVHGYKQWGPDVFNHLNGMFGLAIWDASARRLVVARDAFGIKLVYYKLDRDGLTFGSEIRAVLAASNETPAVDTEAVGLFLQYRYTPAPHTLHQGIRKLAAGTMLVCENGECREERWYRYRPEPFSPRRSDDDAQAELLAIYRRAMKRHLLADVPVGLLLSGGVDSNLLLALMNEHGRDWPTYTVGYGNSFADDELDLAAETARMMGSRHTSVTLDQEVFEEALPKILDALEEPIAGSSIVPMYYVCRRAREDVKVALIGQGPDELFAGYKRHLGLRYSAYWRALPAVIRAGVVRGIAGLPRNETLKRGAYALDAVDRLQRYERTLALLPPDTIESLFRPGLLEAAPEQMFAAGIADLRVQMERLDDLNGFQMVEVRSTLPDELLMYADKLSMAHSLEARVPFLDREVVEYVQRLDASFKVRGLEQKWLHRRASAAMLPATIMRRRKRGFAVNVVDGWFRGPQARRITEPLRDPASLIYDFLRIDSVTPMLDAHTTSRGDYHKVLFSLLAFEYWLRGRASRLRPVTTTAPPAPATAHVH